MGHTLSYIRDNLDIYINSSTYISGDGTHTLLYLDLPRYINSTTDISVDGTHTLLYLGSFSQI